MSRDIEIQLPRCRLVLYENELLLMLREHPNIWEAGLRRGKGLLRARQAEMRGANKMNKAPMDETTRSRLVEQETSICFDEMDDQAELYTASPRVFRLLAARGLTPYRVENMHGHPRSWFFTLPKWSVLIKPGKAAIKIGGARKIVSDAPGVAPSATRSEVSGQ